MERDLESSEGLDKGILLGDEYRHIRNALAHDTVRFLDQEGAVVFVDKNPHKDESLEMEYSYADMVALFHQILVFIMAQQLAEAADRGSTFEALAKGAEKSIEDGEN
jgi:hypothetical protein